MRNQLPFIVVGLAICVPHVQGLAAETSLPAVAARAEFHRDIQPILEQSCVGCHGPRKQAGSYRLDTEEHFRRGGDSGSPIVSGNSAKSDLIHRVARLDADLAMPPDAGHALTHEQIGLLRFWIDQGAPWTEGFVLHARGFERLGEEELKSLPAAANRTIDFVADVQPIFQSHCIACHGPHRQEAEFRLDHKPTAMSGGELGPAIIPKDVGGSLLLHLVTGLRGEARMPRDAAPLSDEQVGILRAWIEQGAEWPESASVVLKSAAEHWAFKPPVQVALPEPKNMSGHPVHPIDAFVGERLQREGLDFSPPASRETLMRRVYLDLIGLPPTLAEQDAFLNDASPDAFTKLVDRLLESPHYGERWGRHWLDAARYADSDGYEKDKPRITHFYRDWVIQAINRDLPYDQFILEQIAGDLLPNATQDQIVATGYLRNSMINEEGGVDPEQFRMEAMFDRIDAIGKGILAIGLNCCQCHSHKYDPISQEEYYRLFACLNNDHEAQPRVYTADETMRRMEILAEIEQVREGLRGEIPDWERRLAEWIDADRASPRAEWFVIRPEIDKNSTGGQRYLPQTDGSFITAGYQPTKSTCLLQYNEESPGITAFRLEMLNDPNLPAGGPGRSFMGTFGLSEFQVEARNAEGKTQPVKIARAFADLNAASDTEVHPNFNEKKPVKRVFGPAEYAIDGNNDTAWTSDQGPGRRNAASVVTFVLAEPLPAGPITIKLVQNIGGWNSDDLQAAQLGRFRLSATRTPEPPAEVVPVAVRQILQSSREAWTRSQLDQVFDYWRTIAGSISPELADRLSVANAKIEELWKAHPDGTTQFTLLARDEPRMTSVLKRGDWLKPGAAVKPGVPAVLHPMKESTEPPRLSLARWLVDRSSPTTARAVVNRMWQAYFGTGLVASSEDFGSQGDAPSHPELLDWLAVDLMDSGWSLKHFHRQLVLSRTYQQSSRVTPELWEKDPVNRLLARGSRLRVEGEVIRDLQLSISGLLNPEVGGRSVMPPAPEFLFQPPASYAPFPWQTETGANRYRRAVYTWRRRTTPYPFLQTFDTPEGNVACVRRTRANTPLQSLMMLNETLSLEAARAFAVRIVREGGSSLDEQLRFAYRVALCRTAESQELEVLKQLVEKQKSRIALGELDPWGVITGQSEPKPDLVPAPTQPAELAALMQAARILLNLDETITKE